MGIFIKNNHGADYLYALAGKSQFFLGRRDDPENLNLGNLRKAAKITDQNFDRGLEKYLEDVKEYSTFLPERERDEYLAKRHAEIASRLGQLRRKRRQG